MAAVGPIDAALAASGADVHLAGVHDLKRKSALDLVVSGLWSRRCADLTRKLLAGLPVGETIVHVHAWQRALTTATLCAIRDSAHPLLLTLHEYGTACPNQGFFDYQRNQICTRHALGAACLATHCDTRTYGHKLWRAGRVALQRAAAGVPSTVDDVIYVSERSRQLLHPYFSAHTHWHIVRNPISAIRESRVPAEQHRSFLFVGRITPEKGAELFAASAHDANVHARIAGDGPVLARIKSSYPSVECLGWLSKHEVHAALRTARALVFPSLWYEVQGLVVQEAMAHGVPALVADGTAAREFVEHAVTGLHFRHMDREDLTRVLSQVDRDDELVSRLSHAAYDRYWNDPPLLERHVEALLRVYEQCLSRRTAKVYAS